MKKLLNSIKAALGVRKNVYTGGWRTYASL